MAVRSNVFNLRVLTSTGVVTRELEVINEDAQDTALEHIILRWPVDTGESRDGWFVESVGTLQWRLANDVEYCEHVHDGIWMGLCNEALGEALEDATRAISQMTV